MLFVIFLFTLLKNKKKRKIYNLNGTSYGEYGSLIIGGALNKIMEKTINQKNLYSL